MIYQKKIESLSLLQNFLNAYLKKHPAASSGVFFYSLRCPEVQGMLFKKSKEWIIKRCQPETIVWSYGA